MKTETSPESGVYTELICEIKNGVGIITLNAEKRLNALSLQMFKELQQTFDSWANDKNVSCIFLRGAGNKAFCAGGDVKQMAQEIIQANRQTPNAVSPDSKPPAPIIEYFKREYKTDYTIHVYEKPVVVWANGIVMGGGIGLANGASHRIVTEQSKFAMPEIAIGLYPDVGATWFLNKMPGSFGLFAGMTGLRMNAADCLYLGLADYYFNRDLEHTVIETLQQIDWSTSNEENFEKVDLALNKLDTSEDLSMSPAEAHVDFVSLFDKIENAIQFRELLNSHADKDDWIRAAAQNFKYGSPSSAHVIFKQLKRGKEFSLEQVFESELSLSAHSAVHPDFAEGVRALLIDKDNKPNWRPATHEEVSDEWIAGYFTKLDESEFAGWLR